LELLWHFAARYAQQGNVGRYSDARIEAALDWCGKRGSLIDGLVQARWLQRTAKYGLLVHDWHVHADDAVRKYLTRNKLEFLTREQDTGKSTGICTDIDRTDSASRPENVRLPSPSPSPSPSPLPLTPLPPLQGGSLFDLTPTDDVPKNGTGPVRWSRAEAERVFEAEFWPIVWAKLGHKAAKVAWVKRATSREVASRLVEKAVEQGPRIMEDASRSKRGPLHPTTWLNGERDEDEAVVIPPVSVNSSHVSHLEELLRAAQAQD
jgi:hypothetical protein